MKTLIPESVIDSAMQILSNQPYVPKSPVERNNDGKVNFCLAAAVAKAGFQVMESESKAKAFEDELVETQSKEVLEQAFVRLGWGVEPCRAKLALNDSTSPSIRKSAVLHYLECLKGRDKVSTVL